MADTQPTASPYPPLIRKMYTSYTFPVGLWNREKSLVFFFYYFTLGIHYYSLVILEEDPKGHVGKTMFSKGTDALNEFPLPRKEVLWDCPIHISLKLLRFLFLPTFLYSRPVIQFPVIQLSLAGWHTTATAGVGDIRVGREKEALSALIPTIRRTCFRGLGMRRGEGS